MIRCYLALGSNLKSPQRQLRQAIQRIRRTSRIHVLQTASLYKTPAWGRKNQPFFYNTVLAIGTTLAPHALLKTCLAIEAQQGRQRKVKWGARTLDIDLIFYGDKQIKTPSLIVPHPRWFERDFVLLPLEELRRRPRTNCQLAPSLQGSQNA